MITIQEIPIEKVNEFWNIHMYYLIEDEIICDEEDIEYFSGNEYRDIILAHMKRDVDRHHMIYFIKDDVKIGAAQYNTYQSEDGKCFILDFRVFPEYRGNGTGHACFYALDKHTKVICFFCKSFTKISNNIKHACESNYLEVKSS